MDKNPQGVRNDIPCSITSLAMYNPYFGQILSLILAVSGNLFLARIFFIPLLDPLRDHAFIFQTGGLIWLIEFLSLHSSGMLSSEEARMNKKVWLFEGIKENKNFRVPIKFILVPLYAIFATGLGLMAHNWRVPFAFFIGVVSKSFGNKAVPDSARIAFSFLLYLYLTFLTMVWPFAVLLLVGLITIFFGKKDNPDRSKLGFLIIFLLLLAFIYYIVLPSFVEIPSAPSLNETSILFWGSSYYFLLAAMEIILFILFLRKTSLPSVRHHG